MGCSYQNSIALSPATEAGSRPGWRVTFLARTRNVTQRMRPDCLRPCALLRANLRHAIQSAVRQNSLCAARAAQTGCRKLDHKALALFGANARSPNRMPQAQTHGWSGYGRPARFVTKLASSRRCCTNQFEAEQPRTPDAAMPRRPSAGGLVQ